MSISILSSKREGNKLLVEYTFSKSFFEKSVDFSFRKLVKDVQIPGFRKGKCTRAVFERFYGLEGLLEEGMKEAVRQSLSMLFSYKELEVAVGLPEDVLVSNQDEEDVDNYLVSFNVVARPELQLKSSVYKGLVLDNVDASLLVSEDEVDEEVLSRLAVAVEYKSSDKPASIDDIVRVDLKVTLNGEEFKWSRENVGVKLGLGVYGEDFDQKLVGMISGDEASFSLDYSSHYRVHEVAGKTVDFAIKIVDVRKPIFPEITDELVASLTDFENLNLLKDHVRSILLNRKKDFHREKVLESAWSQLSKLVELDIPNVMLNKECERILQDFVWALSYRGVSLDNWLKAVGKTLDEWVEEMKSVAKNNVFRTLVLEAIAENESIEVSEDEVRKHYQLSDFMKDKDYNDRAEYVRTYLRSAKSEDVIFNNMLSQEVE